MLRIHVNDLPKVYAKLAESYPLYLPILSKSGSLNYGLYTDDANVKLDVLKTTKSPKDVFFPQAEDLMKFIVKGQSIEVVDIREVAKPFIVMGVRGCDYKAFEVLDKVFLNEPKDTYYENKRKAGIVITTACHKVEYSCFCTNFNVDPTNPMGDVTTWLCGDYLYWRSNTEKGNEVTSLVSSLFEEADDSNVKGQQAWVKSLVEKLPFTNLDLSMWNEENMMPLFNDQRWDKLSEACLGCGACTFVCPTCQCFDIREFTANSGEVKRFRCWDSCMFKDFTKTAGGQPRPTQKQRFRQRFMHKLVYYPSNNEGLYSCVGCGRCVKKCPQHLNIVKVIKEFGGNK